MVCMASRTGLMKRSTRGERAAHTPNGIPMANAITTAMVINDSVSMVVSQSPTRPG